MISGVGCLAVSFVSGCALKQGSYPEVALGETGPVIDTDKLKSLWTKVFSKFINVKNLSAK